MRKSVFYFMLLVALVVSPVMSFAASADDVKQELEKADDEEKALETENETLRKRINELEKEVQALQAKREQLNKKLDQ
jgi:peptidoglycan hydrolase CwlO-like protein